MVEYRFNLREKSRLTQNRLEKGGFTTKLFVHRMRIPVELTLVPKKGKEQCVDRSFILSTVSTNH
jgi:hypothetical protein